MKKFIFLLTLIVRAVANDLYFFDERINQSFQISFSPLQNIINHDSLEIVNNDTMQFVNYPAKPMLYSLIVPGLGQYVNKDPVWKSAMFAGMEVASMIGWRYWSEQADDIRIKYELFGDDHWTLQNWVENTQINPVQGLIQYSDYKLDGTHHLDLHLSGSLADQYGEYVSSDSLVAHPEWIFSEEINVLQDQHFYENIGKYDQFVGGWDDIEDWRAVEKTVEDTIETILMTPNKEHYNNERARSNNLLKLANYAVTAVMFNHVISGLEAVFSNQRKARLESQQNKTDVGLYFNPKNRHGIGGISVTYHW